MPRLTGSGHVRDTSSHDIHVLATTSPRFSQDLPSNGIKTQVFGHYHHFLSRTTNITVRSACKSVVFNADVVENVIDRGCGVAQSWRNRINRGAVLARTWHKRVLSGLSRESRGYNRGAVVAGTWLDRDCRESVVAQSGRVVAATGMYNFLTRIWVFLHDFTPTHRNVSKIRESALSGRS